MNYLTHMLDKNGFEDGKDVPNDAEHYRGVYVVAINALAQAHGITQRAMPFNRPGGHNWCLITFTESETGEPNEQMKPILETLKEENDTAWKN